MEQAFGSQKLAPEYEAKVAVIAKRMGIDRSMIIRKMNYTALRTYGYHNAFVGFHQFFFVLPLVSVPFFFISEGFFEDLSEKEQEFIIGHELVHLQQEHTRYLMLVMIGTIILLMFMWWFCLRPFIKATIQSIVHRHQAIVINASDILSIYLLVGCVSLGSLAYRRNIEWQADQISIGKLETHQGGIQLIERWMRDFKQQPVEPYWGLFSCHPSCTERRNYCIEQKNRFNQKEPHEHQD